MNITLPPALYSDDNSQAVVALRRYFGDPYLQRCYTGAYFDSWPPGRGGEDADRFTAEDLVAVTFLSVTVPPLAARALLVTEADRYSRMLEEVGPDRDLADEAEQPTPSWPAWQRAEHDKDRATADPAPPTTTAPSLSSPPVSTTTTSPTTTTSSTKSGAAVASASKQFLADMTASQETPSTGSASVNGQTYPHSIYGRIGGCTTDVSYSYVLGRQWSQFTATVGLRDGSDSRSVVQFEVYADNNLVYSSDNVAVGQSPVATVPVKDVLNIKIRYLFVQGNKGLCSNAGYAVWGDAAVSK